MEYYVYLNGTRRGPFAKERVQSLLDDGLLLATDLAADDATSDWKPLSAFQRFAVAPLPASASFPIEPIPKASLATANPCAPAGGATELSEGFTISPNETPCYRTSLHWFIFIRFALFGLALLVFAAVPFAIVVQALTGSERGWFVLPLPTFLLLPSAIAFANSEIVITDRRVLIRAGIIRRQSVEMLVSKVESIAVDQGFLGRMFDFGTVRIRGMGGFEEAFGSIAHPHQFRDWIQRLQSGEGSGGNQTATETDVAAHSGAPGRPSGSG